MLKYAIAALALTAAASPALANEGRVEARGGIVWAGGGEEAVAGAAAGYDWDLGESAFIGVEGSADKILVDGIDVLFGATARVGAKLGENGRLYATGGYTFGEGDAAHQPHLGFREAQILHDRTGEDADDLTVEEIEGVDEDQQHQHIGAIAGGLGAGGGRHLAP